MEQKLRLLQLKDVHQDPIGNVLGRIPGTEAGRVLLVSAHLDTVFPPNTDLTVTDNENQDSGQRRISGPGIADNSLGLAGLLVLVDVVQSFAVETS